MMNQFNDIAWVSPVSDSPSGEACRRPPIWKDKGDTENPEDYGHDAVRIEQDTYSDSTVYRLVGHDRLKSWRSVHDHGNIDRLEWTEGSVIVVKRR